MYLHLYICKDLIHSDFSDILIKVLLLHDAEISSPPQLQKPEPNFSNASGPNIQKQDRHHQLSRH